MSKKIYRTFYVSSEYDQIIAEIAAYEDVSISKLIRNCVETYFEKYGYGEFKGKKFILYEGNDDKN